MSNRSPERERMSPLTRPRFLDGLLGVGFGLIIALSVFLPWLTIEWRDTSGVVHSRTFSGLEVLNSGPTSAVIVSPLVILALGVVAVVVAPFGKRWLSTVPMVTSLAASGLNLLLLGGGLTWEASLRPELGIYLPILLGMTWIVRLGFERWKESASDVLHRENGPADRSLASKTRRD